MQVKTNIKYVGGKTTALLNTFIKGILGIILIIVGIIISIAQKQVLFLIILGIIGLVALFNAWYWWRRYQKLM